MTKEQLFESMRYLDDDLIERSETARAARGRWLAAAACVCIVAAAALVTVPRWRGAETAILPAMPVPAPDGVDQPIPDGDEPPVDWTNEAPYSGEPWRQPLPTAADISHPEPTPAPGASDNNWFFLGDGETLPPRAIPALVSSYGADASGACYAAPENGTVGYSVPLRGAMEEYGGSVWYYVVIDLFSDGMQLDPAGDEAAAERERLAALGYHVSLETYFDGTAGDSRFCLVAYHELLESFAVDSGYGYMLFLYDERVPN